MNEFGHYSLLLAWLLALAGSIAGVIFGRKNTRNVSGSAGRIIALKNITLGIFFACAASTFALGYLFHYDDYTNQYVWQYSNKDMSPIYKVSAIWGGMDGSMLLWAFFLSICAGAVAWKSTSYPRLMAPWVLSVLNSSLLFFLTIVTFVTNPFRYLQAPFIPPDGNGLNPLLQNPFMAIHPPMLYAGFTSHAVPFAFCMAALLSGNLSNEWIRLTRRWALLAWSFLTAGIVLGGYWAYIELGWGGFWAWDPVENASFLPWLTSTAFIHSVMVQERKNMLKMWNVWLMVLSYSLTVFGTFLTRSGIVQSVHAFASTDVGWVFLLYLGLVLLLAAWLSFYRRKELRSERKIESFLSREAFFLLNNLFLLSICFSVLWGVMFPVFSEWLTGKKQAVGIPYFNAVNVPLFLGLMLLMGIGPLIAWRKASFSSLRKTFLAPFLFSFAMAVILLWAGVEGFYPILSYALCAFVCVTIVAELHRAVRSKTAVAGGASYSQAMRNVLANHQRRYAGYLVHFGVVLVCIGITASMAHKLEKEVTLGVKETLEIRRFRLTLDSIENRSKPNYEALHAVVSVDEASSGKHLAILEPEMRSYRKSQEVTSEVALLKSWKDDLYIVVAGLDPSGQKASFKIFVNPLQSWLWLGTIIMILGSMIILIPSGKRIEEMAVNEREGARAAIR